MSTRSVISLRYVVTTIIFVIGFVLSTGCTKTCGSVREGMREYHDVCVAVNFREHVERTGSSESSSEDYGLGYDLSGEQVDLIGARVGQLKPHRLYNLRGDFVEVDEKKRLRVFSETDVDSSNQQVVFVLAVGIAGLLVYRWALSSSSRPPKKSK